MMTTNVILKHEQIVQKIRRMAFQIYEQNYDEKEVVFAGIKGEGTKLASLLKREFDKVADVPSSLVEITVDKKAPTQTFIEVDVELPSLEGKVIILVDDVLNTGRTLAYSMKPFFNIRVSKVEVAVLVDRGYHDFPVAPAYIGYELSTTINEHIEVDLSDDLRFEVTLT